MEYFILSLALISVSNIALTVRSFLRPLPSVREVQSVKNSQKIANARALSEAAAARYGGRRHLNPGNPGVSSYGL